MSKMNPRCLALACTLSLLSINSLADELDEAIDILDACSTSVPISDVKAFRDKANPDKIMISTFYTINSFDLARINVTQLSSIAINNKTLTFRCKNLKGCIEHAVGQIDAGALVFNKQEKVSTYDFLGCDDLDPIIEAKHFIEAY
ncbi:hypothetical protein [Pseudomonas chlororaphis]